MKVVYILGTSRSGSTILDLYLSRYSNVISVGELVNIKGFYFKDHSMCGAVVKTIPLSCTCGRDVRDCTFWNRYTRIIKKYDFKPTARKLIRIQYILFSKINQKIATYLFKMFSSQFKQDLENTVNYLKIYDKLSLKNQIIIDSSKSIYHYLLLKSLLGEGEITSLHIIRNGWATVDSFLKGERIKAFKTNSALAEAQKSWVRTNLLCAFHADEIVKYEEFCRYPEMVVEKICYNIGAEDKSRKKIHHNIGGSPSRFNDKKIICTNKNTYTSQDKSGISFTLMNKIFKYGKW